MMEKELDNSLNAFLEEVVSMRNYNEKEYSCASYGSAFREVKDNWNGEGGSPIRSLPKEISPWPIQIEKKNSTGEKNAV